MGYLADLPTSAPGYTDRIPRSVPTLPGLLRAAGWSTERRLIDWCRERMANVKVPRSITFVEALPRNASGKVLRRELRARADDAAHGT